MTDSANAEILARQGIGGRRYLEHDGHGQRDQPHAGQHGGARADHRLDLSMDAEALDDAMQADRDDDRP